MHRDLKISVVIPCYNEENGVREVIGRMPKAVDEIVVVDNNCTDRTAEVARAEGRVGGHGPAADPGHLVRPQRRSECRAEDLDRRIRNLRILRTAGAARIRSCAGTGGELESDPAVARGRR